MPPVWEAVSDTAFSSVAGSVTSASNQSAPGPQSLATARSSSGSSPTSDTRAPRPATLRAASAPMPRAAPVISTVLPCREELAGATTGQPTCLPMRNKGSSPEAVIAILLVLLVVAGIALGSADSEGPATAGARAAAAKVPRIARRVEPIRGLLFEKLPEPLIVKPAQAR